MNNSGNPVVIANRPFQNDLRIDRLQASRESGIALRQENRFAEAQAAGLGQDHLQQLIEAIKHNTDIEIALKVIKQGFIGRVVPLVAATITELIPPSQYPRGYIIQNPAEVSGFSSNVTFFASALRAPATYTSAAFNVSAVDTARMFLDVTVLAAGGTLIVNAQTQDPLTGNWATSQTDIFTGSVAVGTYYASLGQLGVDQTIRLQAVVGVNNVTFSVSGLLKGGGTAPVGTTVYIGNSDVNTTIGYAMLPAQREYWWLDQNVSLYAISPINPMVMKVFQMQ